MRGIFSNVSMARDHKQTLRLYVQRYSILIEDVLKTIARSLRLSPAPVGIMFLPLSSIVIVLASSCRTCLGERQLKHREPELQITEESSPTSAASSTNLPRILTVLTTYNQRNQYIKAYREVADDRTDGYQPMVRCVYMCVRVSSLGLFFNIVGSFCPEESSSCT